MAARSSSRFAVLFVAIAIVIALVAWLALGVGKRADADHATQAAASAPDVVATAPHADTQLTEAKPTQSDATTRATAPLARVKDDTGPTEAELADAWWVHGRVNFAENTPADERAFVVAQGREFGKKKLHRVAVAPDGTFRVAFNKATKKGTLRLEARYVFLLDTVMVKQGDADKDVVLATALGGALSGRVVPSAAAQPFVADLVGATITATGWKRETNGPRVVTALVGETLEFELGGLDPEIRWGVMCSPKGFAQTYSTQPSIVRGKCSPFELKVQRGARLTGTVRDAAGAPIEAAQLQTEARGDDGMGMPENVTTDKNGAFTLEGSRSGKVRVDARKAMYVPARTDEIDLADGESRTNVAIVLQRGNSVAGVVKWKDGKPAGSVKVEVQEPPDENERHFWGMGESTPSAKTNGDGTFTITGLRGGPYTVIARSAPKAVEAEEAAATKDKRAPKVRFQAQADAVPANANALVLVLDSGSMVRGRVHDDRGAAVDAFTVKVEPVREQGERWNARGDDISRDFSDAAGAFELFGLADGEWKVHVETKGGAKSESTSVVLPKDEQVIDFVLARSARLRGVVLDAGGTPVSGAVIHAEIKGAEQSWSNRTPDKSRTTGDDGAFETDVSSGDLEVHATHPGWAASARMAMTIAPAQAAGPVTLTLRKGARITGDVHDKAGKLEAARTVSIWNSDDREYTQATTDASGSFVMEHVSPGKARLSLEPSQAELEANRRPDGSWIRTGSFNSQLEVTLEDGADVHVSLGGASKDAVRVFGVVRASEPLAGVTVSLDRTDVDNRGNARQAVTGDDGHYEVSVDAPGEYRASFRTLHGGNAWIECTIPAASSFELNATLPIGTIGGRVLDYAGKPLVDVNVTLQLDARPESKSGQLQSGIGNVQTIADGSFKVEMLPAGTYTITAEPQRWGRSTAQSKSNGTAKLTGIELAAGGNVTGLELRMPRAGSVRGTVIGPNGPVAEANVTVYAAEQTSFDQTDRTDATGRFQIDGLNPGSAVVVASTMDAVSRPGAIEIRSDQTAEIDLHLEPGGRMSICPVDAQGRVTHAPWTIVDADGKKCRDFPVQWAVGNTADRGWTVGPMPIGKYTVSVGEGEHKVDRQVEVTAGTIQDVRVQFQ